ncbi:WD40-repeat-containing domain protein [Zopfochytrium polystomum]|nr:WD40-repeat-containing domain protein [Zopfochytrium polystomum]
MGGQDGSARVVSERTASAVATTPTETAPTAHRFSRGRKVPKERIDELWRRVKSTFLQKAPDLLKLVSSAAPIPYQITINQGFQIRHRLTCKHPIVCAATHPRLTRHQEEGHTSSLSESVDDLNAESGGADECEDKKRVESVDFLKSASVAAHTFVAVDRARCVRVWDMNASSTKLRHSKTLDEEISRIVLISKYSVYATATHRTTVEFITPKFEHITTLKTEHHVEFLKYFSPLNQLITVGPSTLTVWALKRTVTRGVTSIECSAKHSVNVMAENEEWISAVHLDHRTFRLFVAVNCRIIIFEMHTLRECRRVPRISRKKATAITYYEPFGFTVVGFSDGLVKIVNTSNTVLHFSHSQTKKITCLLVHPHGPFFLSASLDSTIKVFDMHVFKEVYTFHLRERPIDMHLIDDRWLMVQTEESVTILSLSNLLSSFSTITTKSLQMQRVSCTKKSDRILSLSAEGAIRLLSPNNGKVIATCLPFLEADKVLQIACSSLIERLFVLLDSKEIWVVSTEVNPCHVLDIWNMKYNEEKFITLCACEGRYGLKNKDFVLLLGGTTSGELVFFNYFGRMSERRQLHGSAIRNMVYRSDCNILVTTGDDNCIKLSSIDPEKKELLILIRTIDTDFTPRRISILDTCFCATNDDGIVSTYNFLNLANDWRKSQSHSSSDDHTESILSICPVEKLDLFVSASTDQTIKVWDTYNTLVREIKFFQPIRSIVTANKRGDLLVSLANRIDKIPAISYLPPGYLKSLNSMGQFSPNEEAQLPFDEDADVLKNYLALKFQFLHSHQGRFQFYREPYGPHLFPTLNFAVTPRSEFSFVKCDHDNQEKTLDEVAYLELMTQLGGLMQRRLKIIESAKRRLQMEKSEQAQKVRLMLRLMLMS